MRVRARIRVRVVNQGSHYRSSARWFILYSTPVYYNKTPVYYNSTIDKSFKHAVVGGGMLWLVGA